MAIGVGPDELHVRKLHMSKTTAQARTLNPLFSSKSSSSPEPLRSPGNQGWKRPTGGPAAAQVSACAGRLRSHGGLHQSNGPMDGGSWRGRFTNICVIQVSECQLNVSARTSFTDLSSTKAFDHQVRGVFSTSITYHKMGGNY